MKRELIVILALMTGSVLAQEAVEQASSEADQQIIPPPRSGLASKPRASDGKTTDVVYPSTREVVEETIRDAEEASFTAKDYDRIKKLELRRERAKASPYITPPKPVTRTVMVNLDPGVEPRVIRLAKGMQTSIVFSDHSGNPWKIAAVRTNRQIFNDGHQGQGDGKGAGQADANVLMLEPLNSAAYGNVAVTLKGLPTPVIFILTTGQNEVDMMVDAKIPGANPDAGNDVVVDGMPEIDDSLSAFLDGVPPKSAHRLKVEGMGDTEAWLLNRNMYVRTKGAAQYPAYISTARSTNGVSVYRYEQYHPAVTFTIGGQAVTAFVEERAEP